MSGTSGLVDTTGLPEGPWLVAASGGMDSMALLRDLRFPRVREGGLLRPDLVVAHLDHGMRPGSAADARWLAGVCRAWELSLVSRRLASAPTSEEEARVARYAFLEEVRQSTGARAVLTAHHADDQVETVLFRILRGTGLSGLRGIPARRGNIHRPLLHRTRAEIARYVRAHGVPHRVDPTNASPRYTRNRIRHAVIPALEAQGLPQVRRSVLRLARNARRAEAEREALERVTFDSLIEAPTAGRREWSVAQVADWPGALHRRLLRSAAGTLAVSLSGASSRAGLQAMASLGPGQGVDLSGGLRLSRSRDRWILQRSQPRMCEEVEVGTGEPRVGVLRLGARSFRYEWTPRTREPDLPARRWLHLPTGAPLWLRGWRPGDRIQLPYGSKPVAKLLAERGVAAVDRRSTPLLVANDGSVLWVPGTAVAAAADVGPGPGSFILSCLEEAHG